MCAWRARGGGSDEILVHQAWHLFFGPPRSGLFDLWEGVLLRQENHKTKGAKVIDWKSKAKDLEKEVVALRRRLSAMEGDIWEARQGRTAREQRLIDALKELIFQ
jgi:hypothetical protein